MLHLYSTWSPGDGDAACAGHGKQQKLDTHPKLPFSETSPDPSVKARHQTHLIEEKLLGKAGGCGAASLAVGEPGGEGSQLPAGRLKITASSCTTCSELSPADLCCCFLLGGCSPHPAVSPCCSFPPGSGMLPEPRGGVGGPGGCGQRAAQAGLSSQPSPPDPSAPRLLGRGCGDAGTAVASGSPAVTGRTDALGHRSKLSPPCSPRPCSICQRYPSVLPTAALLLILNSTV